MVGTLAAAGAYMARARNGPSGTPESGSDATGIAALVERQIAASGDPAAARAAVEERMIALLAEREELDATVWAEERLAQQYENTFVGLWDDLRNSDNAFDVFRAFEIDETRIGRSGAATPLLEGIHVAPLDQSPETLGRDVWLSLLDRLEAEGFSLVQSEFHHSQFDSNREGGRVSTFSIVLHAVNETRDTRYEITGPIEVTWSGRTNGAGRIVPAAVDATGLTIGWRSGPPMFEHVKLAEFPVEAGDSDNILAYDLDGDDLTDLVAPHQNALFRNTGDGGFDRETLLTHPEQSLYTAALADLTGDGQVDLLVAGAIADSRPPRYALYLYERDPEGAFGTPARTVIDTTAVELVVPSALAVGDIDDDGDLDVFVGQYRNAYDEGNFPDPYYDATDGYPAFLLLNDGEGGLSDATERTGLVTKRHRRTYRASLADLDGDGDLDLIVVNDFAGVDVYDNDGTGRFTDITASAVDVATNFGMSHTFADFDADGALDFYVTGMASTTASRLERMGLIRDDRPEALTTKRTEIAYGNRMYLAQDDGRFEQPSYRDNVARSGWTWGVAAVDINNDGYPDIYAANGHVSGTTAQDYCTRFWTHDIYSGSAEDLAQMLVFQVETEQMGQGAMSWNGFEHNHLFLNLGGRDFANVGFLLGVAMEEDSRVVIADDFDRDGRADILVTTGGYEPANRAPAMHLFLNRAENDHHWVGIALADSTDVSPIGALVTLVHDGGRQTATVVTGDSFMAQHAPVKRFGLGDRTAVDHVEVRWPNGEITRLDGPAVDRYHTVTP